MKIISSSAIGNFKLIDRDQEIYELEYNNLFSQKAKTEFNGNIIEIRPKSIWTSKASIYKNQKEIGDISMNLKGQIVIKLLTAKGNEFNFFMKNKGLWNPKFKVFNDAKVLQFSLNSANNWKKLNYDYTIEMAEFRSEFDFKELLIYCGYAANLYLALISAA